MAIKILKRLITDFDLSKAVGIFFGCWIQIWRENSKIENGDKIFWKILRFGWFLWK